MFLAEMKFYKSVPYAPEISGRRTRGSRPTSWCRRRLPTGRARDFYAG
jgi:hypothetical protein